MPPTRTKSATASAVTGGAEFVAFTICSLHFAGLGLLAARWLVGASGACANFVLNRRWAFACGDRPRGPQVARYAATLVCAVTLGTLVWWAADTALNVDTRVLQAGSMASVWALFTYPTMKRWVFRASREATPSDLAAPPR